MSLCRFDAKRHTSTVPGTFDTQAGLILAVISTEPGASDRGGCCSWPVDTSSATCQSNSARLDHYKRAPHHVLVYNIVFGTKYDFRFKGFCIKAEVVY